MSGKKIRVLFVVSGVLVAVVLIVGVVFASTSSSSEAQALARTAAVERGFKTEELVLRNFKMTECLGGLFGEEAYVEFAVKDSDPLQTVRIDLSRGAFQPSWQVQGTSVTPAAK